VILDALDRLMHGRTSLMIAHRLSTIRSADLIVVVNRGRVAEVGSHEELLTSGGLYYQLYEAQHGEVAAIEAEHLLRKQAEGLVNGEVVVSTNGEGTDGATEHVNGGGLDREVIDSLARAVRQRIRISLANGDTPEQGVNDDATEPNGDHAGGDAPPPEADRGPTP
jgi:ABC-type multidrug transport system ATPase subunit